MPISSLLRFGQLAHSLEGVRTWDPVRLQALQSRRLRQMLRFAATNSPFYREKFAGFDLDRVELSQLPTTTKEELREQFDRVVTSSFVTQRGAEEFMADEQNLGRWYRDRYSVSHTSGSVGAPLLIVQDRRTIELMFALSTARGNVQSRPTLLEGLRRIFSPLRIAVVTFRRGFYPSGASFEYLAEMLGPVTRVERFSSIDPDLINKLRAFQPQTIVSYASVLEALALKHDQLALKNLQQISSSSEQLTPRARERIEQAFRVPVIDHYGLGECLFLSDGCPYGGIHINADWAILEVVDDENRPVSDGVVGSKVLITNLANQIQPFIRYEVGDRLAISRQPCRCGSLLPRIERLAGRAVDVFWVTGTGQSEQMVTGVLFHTAVDEIGNIREWQATQTDRDRIELKVELLPRVENKALIEHRLREKLYELGLPRSVELSVLFQPWLYPDAKTGKMRRMTRRFQPAAAA